MAREKLPRTRLATKPEAIPATRRMQALARCCGSDVSTGSATLVSAEPQKSASAAYSTAATTPVNAHRKKSSRSVERTMNRK